MLSTLGEGSFGRVYQVEHRASGNLFAMKTMKKQELIKNNQIRYAIAEAEIMREL